MTNVSVTFKLPATHDEVTRHFETLDKAFRSENPDRNLNSGGL